MYNVVSCSSVAPGRNIFGCTTWEEQYRTCHIAAINGAKMPILLLN